VGVTLEVAYADAAALKHDAETQLERGGLYVTVDASALPPLCELTLRLIADGFAAEAAARLTVATAQAACVEVAPDAAAALLAAVAGHVGDVAPAAGIALARFVDGAAAAEQGDGVGEVEEGPDTRGQIPLDRKIAAMSVGEKIQLALHGNREARQLLMRDRAGVVQSSLVRNPKITLDEVQALARAPQLSPETAETLAQHPTYGLSPQIALALVRNPRTPVPVATQLIARLQPADLRAVAKGLGVRAQVAAAARKRLLDH
jgi:hypothetical protein